MSDLGEKAASGGLYDVHSLDSYLIKAGCVNRDVVLLGRKTLTEAYVEGRNSLHVHLRVRSRGIKPQVGDLCAVYQRRIGGVAKFFLDWVRCRIPADEIGEAHWVREAHGRLYDPVFVTVPEGIENVEGMKEGINSVVRLQPLNKCPSIAVWVDALERVAVFRGTNHAFDEFSWRVCTGKALERRGFFPSRLTSCQTKWSNAERRLWM